MITSWLKSVISKTGINPQLIGFLVVGGLSTVLNLGLAAALVWGLGLRASFASGIGYVAGVALGYLLNKAITFGAGATKHSTVLLPYLLVYAISFAISFGLIELVNPGTDLQKVVTLLIATILTTILNFVLTKFLVFRA